MFMKQLLFSLIFASFISDAVAQTIVSADLERRKTRSGIMILYFGNNRIIQQCALYDIAFSLDDTPDRIADIFRNRIASPYAYIMYEFKEGYDCNNARSYLKRKGVSEASVLSCLIYSFNENKEGTALLPGGGRTYWNDPDNVTPTHVMQLDTYGWAIVNRFLAKREEELKMEGWKAIYTEYNLAGGPKDERWVGKSFSASPDSMYKVIAVVNTSSYVLKFINGDKKDEEGYYVEEYTEEKKGGEIGETFVFHPKQPIVKLLAAATSLDRVNTNVAGIIVFRKKYNFGDEFQSVLDKAHVGFAPFRVSETKDPNGVTVFTTKKTFGINTQMVYQNSASGKWYYTMSIKKDQPELASLKNNALELIEAYVKTQNYTTESGEYDGNKIHRLKLKDGSILFQMLEKEGVITFVFFGK